MVVADGCYAGGNGDDNNETLAAVIQWDKYPNFTEAEFACHGDNCCGGKADMDPAFVSIIQQLRDSIGRGIAISSGYRCPEHNNRVSSTGLTGPHTTGKAADLLVSKGTAFIIVKTALLWGIKGLGVSQKGDVSKRFIHLDMVDRDPPTIWSY